jgi:hypothetical protein
MKHGFLKSALLPAALAGLAGAASAGPVLNVECSEGVYHQKPFAFTVDLGTGEVTNDSLYMTIIPGGLTETEITFGYMRGNAVFHRNTRVLEWDARGQYEYEAAIGHPPTVPIETFMGSAVCKATETR